jgi:hypothetical protein
MIIQQQYANGFSQRLCAFLDFPACFIFHVLSEMQL